MTIDYFTDPHIDFYAKFNTQKINALVDRLLNTKTNSDFDVLVIAGDIGHYNDDNVYFLSLLAKYYKKVLITWGNHDLYLLPSNREKYNYNSFNRLNEFKEMIKEIDNVVFLDGQKVEYEGITFWGSGLWYEVASLNHWCNYMNDAKYIFDRKEKYTFSLPYEWYPIEYRFDPYKLYERELEKINKLDRADVIISNIPPINFGVSKDMGNYYFVPYGEMIIERVKPKMWIFGHTHIKRDLKFNNCRLLCNPLGYPDENREFKIESVEV